MEISSPRWRRQSDKTVFSSLVPKVNRLNMLVTLLFLFPATIKGRQAFEEEPLYREVNPGEDVIMNCR